jgi:hypothetical protein
MQPLKKWRPIPYLLAFLGLGILRALPEAWIGPTPIGYDASTSYVTAFLGYDKGLGASLRSFSLLYYFFEICRHLGFDALLTIKATGVILYVLVAGCFFLLVRDAFRWSSRFSVYATLLWALQLDALRFSWDLYRNELGLAWAFLCLWQGLLFVRDRRPWRLAAVAALATLTFGTHQITSFALLMFGIGAGVIALLKTHLSRRWLLVLILVTAVVWPLIASHVQIEGFSLWSPIAPPATERLLPFNLAYLLFLPFLAGFALIGFGGTWIPELLLVTLLLGVQSFATILPGVHGFYLWDRWMYFFAIPLTIYALLGIHQCVSWIRPWRLRGPIYLVVLAILVYPGLQFGLPHRTLYGENVNSAVFDIFPASIDTNAFIPNPFERQLNKNLGSCLRSLAHIHNGSTAVVIKSTYIPVAIYYAPTLAGFFTAVPPLQSYYLFDYTRSTVDGTTQPVSGVPASCPIFFGTTSAR